MSPDGLRYLATRVIRYGLSTMVGYQDCPGFAFWCDVLGLDPVVVRARLR